LCLLTEMYVINYMLTLISAITHYLTRKMCLVPLKVFSLLYGIHLSVC